MKNIRDLARAGNTQEGTLETSNTGMAGDTGVPMNREGLKLSRRIRPVRIAQPQLAANYYELTPEENARFLRLVMACARVTTRYEMFLLVQGQLQFFLPQEILIAAWGQFRAKDPQVDVISNLPGVHAYDRTCDTLVPFVKHLYNIWIEGGRKPVFVNKDTDELQTCINDACALPCNFPDVRLSLVHGVENKRDGHDSLYIALLRHPCAINGAAKRLRVLADAVIHQIDVAHRKSIAPHAVNALSKEHANPFQLLSGREKEIAHWVCQGKTNGQIAQIVGISVNTVKNHLHRIFGKLGANNRTEVVFKCRGMAGSAEFNYPTLDPDCRGLQTVASACRQETPASGL